MSEEEETFSNEDSPPKKQQKRSPVDEYTENVIDGWPVTDVPPRYYKQVVKKLQEKKAACIKDGDYLQAQFFEDKSNEILEISTEACYGDDRNTKLEKLQQRLALAQQELEYEIQKSNRILDGFEREKEKAMNQLIENHNEQLLAFDEKNQPPMPPKFQKYSPEYLNLRKREQFMVSSKRYAEASSLKAEADQMKIVEDKQNEQKWQAYVAQQRKQLVDTMKQQMVCSQNKWAREKNALKISADKQITNCQNLVTALENKVNEAESECQATAAATVVTTRCATQMSTSRGTTSRNDKLPPLSSIQTEQLKSRMPRMRASNYARSRMMNRKANNRSRK